MTNRKFAPLLADHPLIGQECPVCHTPFEVGAVVTLIALGPGKDPEAQERAREGRPYNAVAMAAHWTCVTGEE